MKIRHFALASTLALAAPAAALDARAPDARDQWGAGATQTIAYREGYDRGLRAGEEDRRRNQSFNFTDESDYRSANAGYRSQYGDRGRYREDFRRGYVEGYRVGYARDGAYADGRAGGWGRRGGGPPPWANGRGAVPYGRGGVPYGRGGVPYGQTTRYDLAVATGYNDGYEAGLDDGRDRRRNNPVAESRYRNGDRGYRREYGAREVYKIRYREGFLQGYERGHQDGRRYSGRSWWPFGGE
jgi:hypothetical protein